MPPFSTDAALAMVGAFLVPNVVTFLVYGWDKLSAGRRVRRVSERALLTLAALGGAPGAWIACRTFRHKTRKSSFRWRLVALTPVGLAIDGLLLWGAWQLAAR